MPTQLTYKLVIFSCQNELENTPVFHSSFSGKEKDSETGYYYFGARYYNPDLSLWLSVDPMSDKYPSLSPYNYCAWNPMKLVDPDGMRFDSVTMNIVNDFRKNTISRISEATSGTQKSELQSALDELSILESSDQLYHIEYGNTSGYNRNGEIGYDTKNDMVSITMTYSSNISDIAHELKHAYQFEVGELSFNTSNGGCITSSLYDITDERSAYIRGYAFGGSIPRNLEWTERTPIKNSRGFYYPFLENTALNPPNVGGGKTENTNSQQIHFNSHSRNNTIYRYNGKTFKF